MWEYLILLMSTTDAMESTLDDLGRLHWELVTVIAVNDKILRFFLKRTLQ